MGGDHDLMEVRPQAVVAWSGCRDVGAGLTRACDPTR